jgi:hypothetical protein
VRLLGDLDIQMNSEHLVDPPIKSSGGSDKKENGGGVAARALRRAAAEVGAF